MGSLDGYEPSVQWQDEFARVIRCGRCNGATDRHLLRDGHENLPQPGYVGLNYEMHRVLLVGQNPGTPKSLGNRDQPYMAALRSLGDNPTEVHYKKLATVLTGLIPQWPIHGNYFPLPDCGLTLDDIAYCNIVRCRTTNDHPPGQALTSACVSEHFSRWLQILQPRVVIFIGRWAYERGIAVVAAAGIPHTFMNRQRSLASAERTANRAAVVALVRARMAGARTPEARVDHMAPTAVPPAAVNVSPPNAPVLSHRVESTPCSATLNRLSIYCNGQYIGEYERAQAADVDRKKEEVACAMQELFYAFKTFGEFQVRWDGKRRLKSIRVNGVEVGQVPERCWRKPSRVKSANC